MDEVRVPPLRSVDDFILASARFGMPNYEKIERWNNRVMQNLLYYQANYFVVAFIVFCIVLFFRPFETLLGGAIFISFLALLIYISSSRNAFQRFCKNNPALSIALIVAAATLVMYQFGSVLVFVFSVALPMLIILLHASFRLRNIRNKVTYVAELLRLKSTPMGVLLTTIGVDIQSLL